MTKLIRVSTNLSSHKFTGYEWDSESNLEYAHARMYGHNRGRFTRPDPSGIRAANTRRPQTLNRYSYVNNDPINFVDRTGLIPAYVQDEVPTPRGVTGPVGIQPGGKGPAPNEDVGNPEEGGDPSGAGPPTPCSGIQGFDQGVGRFTAQELNDAAIAIFGELSPKLHEDIIKEARAIASMIFNRSDAILAGKALGPWGETASLTAVVTEPKQFVGYFTGRDALRDATAAEFNEGERNCTRLQVALNIIAELASGKRPYDFVYNWSNYGGTRPRLPGEERIGGNDFSANYMGKWTPEKGWHPKPDAPRPKRD